MRQNTGTAPQATAPAPYINENVKKCCNCGNTIADDASFCPYCGTQASHSMPHSTSQQGKVNPDDTGAHIVCPYCGKQIQSNCPHCPACGHKLLHPDSNSRKKSSLKMRIIIAVGLCVALIAAGCWFFREQRSNAKDTVVLSEQKPVAQEEPTNENVPPQTPDAPAPQEETQTQPADAQNTPDTPVPDTPSPAAESGLTDDYVLLSYKNFFYASFLKTDLACVVDITHDGIDDLIVVHFCDEPEGAVNGYVYTLDSTGEINLIYTKTGSHFHYGAGGFFDWYIGETESGYILASEEGFWSTGVGELTFHEYYLTQNGEVCDVSTISIASGDYENYEDVGPAFEYYAGRKAEKKSKLYTIYSATAYGTDPDTLGSYCTDPADTFFLW